MPETKLTEDEMKAMTEARRASEAMVKRLSQPGDNHIVVDDLVTDKESNERVILMVPRNFFVVLGDHSRVKFNAGVCSVPAELSDHWYVKANGCKVYAGGMMPKAVVVPAALLGSDELPSVVRIGADKRPIGDFILAAQASAKMSIVDWNALPEDERRDRISEQVKMAFADMRSADAQAQREADDKAAKQAADDKAAAEAKAKADVDAAAKVEADKAAPDADKAS